MNEAHLKNKVPYSCILTRVNEMKRKYRDILFLRYTVNIASQMVQQEARYQLVNIELPLTMYGVSEMHSVIHFLTTQQKTTPKKFTRSYVHGEQCMSIQKTCQ